VRVTDKLQRDKIGNMNKKFLKNEFTTDPSNKNNDSNNKCKTS
jgi:hypothetical protein